MAFENVSPDLIWQVTNGSNAFLVKRKQSGGVRFSKDPFNLTNVSSRKYDGFVNSTAISVQPAKSGKGVTIATKIPDNVNRPAKASQRTTLGAGKSSRSLSKAVVKRTTKRGYRADLRQEAVARASQIKKSQRPVKETPAAKPRGKKAKAAQQD